jgi:hypothetical protein
MQARVGFGQSNAARIDHQAKDQQAEDQADGSLHNRVILTYTISVANRLSYGHARLHLPSPAFGLHLHSQRRQGKLLIRTRLAGPLCSTFTTGYMS